jgi:hypothetical protein
MSLDHAQVLRCQELNYGGEVIVGGAVRLEEFVHGDELALAGGCLLPMLEAMRQRGFRALTKQDGKPDSLRRFNWADQFRTGDFWTFAAGQGAVSLGGSHRSHSPFSLQTAAGEPACDAMITRKEA